MIRKRKRKREGVGEGKREMRKGSRGRVSLFESYCMNIEGSVGRGEEGNERHSKAKTGTGALIEVRLGNHDL